MRITCKLSSSFQDIEVSPDEPLYILLEKLNNCDKFAKLLFKGETYEINCMYSDI